jgi:hypothetical protein
MRVFAVGDYVLQGIHVVRILSPIVPIPIGLATLWKALVKLKLALRIAIGFTLVLLIRSLLVVVIIGLW